MNVLFISSVDNGPGNQNVHLSLYDILSKIYVFREYLIRYHLHLMNFENQKLNTTRIKIHDKEQVHTLPIVEWLIAKKLLSYGDEIFGISQTISTYCVIQFERYWKIQQGAINICLFFYLTA